MEDKSKLIEAILFWKGEPISLKKLSELISEDTDSIRNHLSALKDSLVGRGIVLMEKDNEFMLATSPEASEVIENLTKEELSKELSKATLETLSIILYMSPIRRSSIDYIRGVNSQFSIRHLEMRGLVEKVPDQLDNRVYLYRPTFELLSFLGSESIDKLPEFEVIKSKLQEFEKGKEDASSKENDAPME